MKNHDFTVAAGMGLHRCVDCGALNVANNIGKECTPDEGWEDRIGARRAGIDDELRLRAREERQRREQPIRPPPPDGTEGTRRRAAASWRRR
jgi:hypothetical protein